MCWVPEAKDKTVKTALITDLSKHCIMEINDVSIHQVNSLETLLKRDYHKHFQSHVDTNASIS